MALLDYRSSAGLNYSPAEILMGSRLRMSIQRISSKTNL